MVLYNKIENPGDRIIILPLGSPAKIRDMPKEMVRD